MALLRAIPGVEEFAFQQGRGAVAIGQAFGASRATSLLAISRNDAVL
jgi:hypothetical protein